MSAAGRRGDDVEEVLAAFAGERLRVTSAVTTISRPDFLRVRVEFDSGPDGRLDVAVLNHSEGGFERGWTAWVPSRTSGLRRSDHGTLGGVVALVRSAVLVHPRSEYVASDEWLPLLEVTRRPEVRDLVERGELPEEVLRVHDGRCSPADLAVARVVLGEVLSGVPVEWVARRHPRSSLSAFERFTGLAR